LLPKTLSGNENSKTQKEFISVQAEKLIPYKKNQTIKKKKPATFMSEN
jgi:hypothetical protein